MTGVLFIQSQQFAGADTMMHAQLMRYLDRGRFTVHAACNRADDPNEPTSAYAVVRGIPGVQTVRADFGSSASEGASPKGPLRAAQSPGVGLGLLRLARYVRRNDIRLIHCTEKPRDAVYGLLLARLTGAACIIHLHVKYEGWINGAVRRALPRADAVIGVSEFVRRSAIEAGAVRPERAFAAVNGLDLARWDGEANLVADGAAVRREYGVRDGTPLIGVASRLFVWKGHLDLLAALAPLKARGRDFRLLVVGEDDVRGAPDRPPFSRELRQAVAALDLEDRVSFSGWRRDMPAVMAAFDIYAMPTFEEPCAVVFLEAMAARLPIVALRSGGTPEEVEHGRSGLLSAPGEIAALSANLDRLLADAELRRLMGAYGRATVEGRLSAPAMALRVEAIYQTLLDRRGQAAPANARQSAF
jgi:glycosyltransferase involved in cell wall biosynthesis